MGTDQQSASGEYGLWNYRKVCSNTMESGSTFFPFYDFEETEVHADQRNCFWTGKRNTVYILLFDKLFAYNVSVAASGDLAQQKPACISSSIFPAQEGGYWISGLRVCSNSLPLQDDIPVQFYEYFPEHFDYEALYKIKN